MTTARFRIAAALALALTLLLPGLAAAAPPGEAFVRLAHLSPDTPDVDVHLASVSDPELSFDVPGVGYGAVSAYRSLPTGTYTVAMREAGAPADSPPVISTTLTTDAGGAYTVAGTGRYSALGLEVLPDDLSMPAPGEARVRVINAAASAASVGVAFEGGSGTRQDVASDVGFAGTTGYRSVPAGPWTLLVDVAGRSEPVSVPVTVEPNSVASVLLLDGPDGIVAQLHGDSAGAATVPLGSVATGFGGMAGDSGPGLAIGAALLAAVAVAAALAARVRRARR